MPAEIFGPDYLFLPKGETLDFDEISRLGQLFVQCGVQKFRLTGGEPLLQLDKKLIDALHILKFEIAIETNGTILAPDKIDWICVSPKSNASIIQKTGDELKLVFPQLNEQAQPEEFTNLKFKHFFLQPLESKDLKRNTKLAIEYCLSHPQWKLSIQTHKTIGIS